MSRPLRLELSGGLYHVTSRGDRREDIYHDDTNGESGLEALGQCCERYCLWCPLLHREPGGQWEMNAIVQDPLASVSDSLASVSGWINMSQPHCGQ
mgnify:FL=1